MILSHEVPKLSIGMSTEQKKTAWDITKMIVAVLLGISSFGLVNLYRQQVDEDKRQTEVLNSLNSRMQQFEMRMVRVEYELKLK